MDQGEKYEQACKSEKFSDSPHSFQVAPFYEAQSADSNTGSLAVNVACGFPCFSLMLVALCLNVGAIVVQRTRTIFMRKFINILVYTVKKKKRSTCSLLSMPSFHNSTPLLTIPGSRIHSKSIHGYP